MQNNVDYFSDSFDSATKRIHRLAIKNSLKHTELDISNGLTINVYTLNNNSSKTYLLTSGIHGVEGYLGSALQLAFLDNMVINNNCNLIIIHIINPYGMINNRRWNSENIDLNRNFWISKPNIDTNIYNQLNGFINPINAKQNYFFTFKAVRKIIKHGFKSLQQSVAQGQYIYPKGLFYGGNTNSIETKKITSFLSSSLSKSTDLFGFDIHCGLGKYGSQLLLFESELPEKNKDEIEKRLQTGIKYVQIAATDNYKIEGGFINSLSHIVGKENNKMITLEVGTSKPLKIFKSLRNENFLYQHTTNIKAIKKSQLLVKNQFLPNDPKWKDKSISQCLKSLLDYYNSI